MVTNPEVLAVLARAAATKESVAVKLHNGQNFHDGVCEVFSAHGVDYVIFHAHNRIYVAEITDCKLVPECCMVP